MNSPTRTDYHVPLEPGGVYHLLTHAVGGELLFRDSENYRFFLRKYVVHVAPYFDTFAWCLLPNHLHVVARVKPYEELADVYVRTKRILPAHIGDLCEFAAERFSNCFNSYAKSYNEVFHRRGALFCNYLRRVRIESEEQFGGTIYYVHRNPAHHGLVTSLQDWP